MLSDSSNASSSSNSDTGAAHFWNAARVLALGAVQRLDYNRRRYELSDEAGSASPAETPPDRHEIAARIHRLILNVQAFQNLRNRYETSNDERFISGLMLLFQRINTQLYTLHHDVLEHEADAILPLIDPLDAEMKRWSYALLDDSGDDTLLPDESSVQRGLKNLHQLRQLASRHLPPA
ncbi:MAG: hypothetical protein ACOC2C_00070 [Cyclonatronaceae bacterium]